jgi:hypothetical protein
MEVHTHSHTERKKWTHYLWEFLMLFLAVFCGFLAEYQLEHTIEHSREKQYIQSMIEDVEKDTASLDLVINYHAVIIPGLDSLCLQCYKFENNYTDIKNLYRLHKKYGPSADEYIEFNDKTLAQLKNAGGMRLIRNKTVADSITLYDNRIKKIKSFEGIYGDVNANSYYLSLKLFNRFYYRTDTVNSAISPADGSFNIALVNNDKKMIIEYGNTVESLKSVLIDYVFLLKQTKLQASNLIQTLKKEYHLE